MFIEPKNTTPEPLSLQQTFHNMVEAGVKNVAIEVSSHALELHRVDYCRFKVALFTNLTPEHLDFHPTMDEYFEAKYKLIYDADIRWLCDCQCRRAIGVRLVETR